VELPSLEFGFLPGEVFASHILRSVFAVLEFKSIRGDRWMKMAGH
jgi:hypothetical protein